MKRNRSDLNFIIVSVSIKKRLWHKAGWFPNETHTGAGVECCHKATVTYTPNTNCCILRRRDHVTTIPSETCPSHRMTMSLENKRRWLRPCGWINGIGRDIPHGDSDVIASNNQMGIRRTKRNWPNLKESVRKRNNWKGGKMDGSY